MDRTIKKYLTDILQVIGEAITRIRQIMPDIPITDARKIKGTRNYLIHAYDSLRPLTIWGIVINHLPRLKEEVIILLNEH